MIKQMNEKAIEHVLRRQLVGHLGCHAEGVTYVVPISYAYDGEFIYCHTKEGMKMTIMRKNPDVCFQVDWLENMANWQSVVIWGVFEELKAGKDRDEALKQLMERISPAISSETLHLNPDWPFHPEKPGSIKGIVFRIRLQKKTGRSEKTNEELFYAT